MKLIRNISYGIITVAIIIVLSCVITYAAPIENQEISLTQPDGTHLDCYASGDEYFNYLHDSNGNIIMQHPNTGYYVYAQIDENSKLVASENVAVNNDHFYSNNDISNITPIGSRGVVLEDVDLSVNAELVWNAEEDNIETPNAEQDNNNDSQAIGIVNSQPLEGKMENIIVMICFSDENPEISSSIKNKMESVFNAQTFSLKDYMKTISQGMLEVNSTLVGMDGNTMLMYQDSHPRSYYRAYNEVTNPDGYQGGDNGSQRTQREHELLKNAIEAINGSSLLEGKNLDIDGNGYVDSISFFVSGNVNGWNSLLWPHKWSLYSSNVKLNGSRVYGYSFQLLDRTFPTTGSSDLSVICHETLHVFGLPDLYRYSVSGNPVGAWDIMASNNKAYPQIPNAHSLLRYAGWGNALVEITGNGRYTLNSVGNSDGITAYAIKTNNPNEFILLEYRSERNTTNYNKLYKDLASSYKAGLTVTRINTAYSGNSSGTNEEVYVYRPNDSGYNSGYGNIDLASLSSDANRTTIGKNTENADYNGSIYLKDGSNTNYIISNVSELGDTLSFDIEIEEDAEITDKIPDNNFLKEVRKAIGKTNGEPIYKSDVMNITKLDVSAKRISSLEGIEYFTGLKEFFCVSNRFKTLDLSKNTRLEILDCSYNLQMTSLNVSRNTELKELYCNYAKLSSIDISKNKKLIKLICYSNQLNQLNLSANKAIEDVNCSQNYLTTLDISNNKKLKNLDCTNNRLLSDNEVVGWTETDLVLGETFKFAPQRAEINLSPVRNSSKMYPLDATYVSQHDEDNNKNFYGESVLKVNYTAKENNSEYWGKYAYLKFDVSNIPKEWIKSAKLKLYVENGTDYRKSTREIGIYDTYINNWDGSTMTWSSGKVDAKSLLVSFTVTATGYAIEDVGWHEADITEYLKYNCIDDKLSLMIKAVSAPAYETTITSGMEGNTSTSNIPVLEIEYEAESKIMPWRLDYEPSSDTYVYQHESNENFEDNEILSVNYTSDDTRTDYWGQDTYLSFNIGNMTTTAKNNIGHAVLWLYVDESSDKRNSTRTINVSANDGLKYNARTLTWSANRMTGDVNIGDFIVQGNGYVVKDPGWRQIDVTEFIKSATNTDIEFILKMTSEQSHPVYIHSMEYPTSDTRPKLIIENRTSFVDISNNYYTEISPSQSLLYKYIPKSDNEYILSSVGGMGSSAILLDENMNKLEVSENVDGEFKLIHNLEKDKKYYINILSNSLIDSNYKLYIETPLEVIIK